MSATAPEEIAKLAERVKDDILRLSRLVRAEISRQRIAENRSVAGVDERTLSGMIRMMARESGLLAEGAVDAMANLATLGEASDEGLTRELFALRRAAAALRVIRDAAPNEASGVTE